MPSTQNPSARPEIFSVVPRYSNRLVVVSNRVGDLSNGSQSGGLAVAVGEALKANGGLWFGWSGHVSDTPAPPHERRFGCGVTTATMDFTPEEHELYYLGFSNRCLWPLFHYRLDLIQISDEEKDAYFATNDRIAEELCRLIHSDDRIWIQDYHLIPLAAALRKRHSTGPIGFFLHIPFPPPEVFTAVPHHERLARCLFACDVIGFQTHRDRQNFARYVTEVLGGQALSDNRLQAFGQTAIADAFPIGIDAGSFAQAARDGATRMDELIDRQKVIIGVDRLDYTKGLPQRIEAFETLLTRNQDLHGKVTMLQIAPPTRDGVKAYADIRAELESAAGRVNGRFGDFDWVPVRYVHRAYPRDRLATVYRLARVGLITPLRDGMNLVAKEYVAAQDPEDPGVLILSHFAGAAEQLKDALLVNPYDSGNVAAAIERGLEMGLEERRARHRALLRNVVRENVDWWYSRFLSALDRSSVEKSKPPRTPVAVA
jgi:trehalose 6-phosphate synthase